MENQMLKLFTDGGCSRKNPSPYGISWAYVAVDENDTIIKQESGAITTESCGKYKASNNLAEMIAAVKALEYAAQNNGDSVILYSDSELTLNRIFKDYSKDGLPNNVVSRLGTAVAKINKLSGILVGGHPSKKELKAGIGKKGLPVSKYNVLCDKLCKEEAKTLLPYEPT
jgi:ribonuclease HI